MKQYFPILDWSKDDVARFVADRGIKCHPLYYDAQGVFHPERRLGCIGCPLQHDHGRADYLKHPKMLKALLRAMQTYKDTKPAASWHRHFGEDVTVYKVAVFHLFFDSVEEFNLATGNGGGELFDNMELNYKQYLEDYFKIDLTL
ncbi:MAG: phosphoadenosine phosphosulfate reductase family protein [Bacteroidales bacterium]|nr:phosphoadenosine phosphosulfate reductase family protein [Bacteroidales bacterium]